MLKPQRRLVARLTARMMIRFIHMPPFPARTFRQLHHRTSSHAANIGRTSLCDYATNISPTYARWIWRRGRDLCCRQVNLPICIIISLHPSFTHSAVGTSSTPAALLPPESLSLLPPANHGKLSSHAQQLLVSAHAQSRHTPLPLIHACKLRMTAQITGVLRLVGQCSPRSFPRCSE